MKLILKIATTALLMGLILASGFLLREHFEIEKLHAFFKDLGIWAPIMFIGVYTMATVLFLPGSVLTLAGGFIFGPYLGYAYSMSGAMIGCMLAFGLSRWVAHDFVTKKVGGKLKVLNDGVAKEGWKFVAVMRLIPALPFNLLNYALGLTKVSFTGYALASLIFMSPGCFAYTYLGYLGMEAIEGEPADIIRKAFIGLSLIVVVAILPWLVKTLRKGDADE